MIFSIITVAKNNLAGLQQTFDSVISQSCRDWEWVVIDGASKDGTKFWLESLEDERIHWISESDPGIYSAMNKGIKMASGQYLIFLNGGDCLAAKDVFQRLADFQFHLSPKPGLIYGDTLEQERNGRTFYKKARHHAAVELGMFTSHQSMLFSKDIFTNLLYGEERKLSSDYALVCELLRTMNPNRVSHVEYPISKFSLGGSAFKNRWIGIREDFVIRRQILNMPFIKNAALLLSQLLWHLIKLIIPWRLNLRVRKIVMK